MGDADGIFIPDLGRARAGEGRFRGIRLVHTHLRNEPLSEEDLTDLIRLRFDLIAAIGVGDAGRPSDLHYTHLMPLGSHSAAADPIVEPIHQHRLDFEDFILALEDEFSRRSLATLETAGQTRAIAVHVSLPNDEIRPAGR